MRTIIRSITAGIAGAAFLLGALAPGFALTSPSTFPPRYFQTQQTHYVRFTVNFNSCVLVSNSCTFKIGALPYNAFVVRGTQQIVTSFNSATTDTVAVGITSTNANELVAAQSVHGAAGVSTLTIAATGAGTQVTGNGATQTGSDGGFDIWVKYAQTGAAPSAGQAVIVLEYFAPNDGTCAPVPIGATAAAC
jgi:hypothetical protein